jgi:hypothetical protein
MLLSSVLLLLYATRMLANRWVSSTMAIIADMRPITVIGSIMTKFGRCNLDGGILLLMWTKQEIMIEWFFVLQIICRRFEALKCSTISPLRKKSERKGWKKIYKRESWAGKRKYSEAGKWVKRWRRNALSPGNFVEDEKRGGWRHGMEEQVRG